MHAFKTSVLMTAIDGTRKRDQHEANLAPRALDAARERGNRLARAHNWSWLLYARAPLVLAALALALTSPLEAQPGSFTYQGRLVDGGVAANGSYDFRFGLYSSGGTQWSVVTILGVPVTNGIFTVALDFEPFFIGADRFLEVRVKPAGSADPYVTLSPRQPILSAPYAIRAAVADPDSGSDFYIRNGTGAQADADFNISGNGIVGDELTAGYVDARYFYQLDGIRVLDANELQTTSVGFSAAVGGTDNTFLGYHAGGAAIFDDTNDNTFIGSDAGGGIDNGDQNTFVGSDAGDSTTVGHLNTFIGRLAGESNTEGDNNTLLGAAAQVGGPNLHYATAIGAGASVGSSNSVVLGRAADTVRIPGNLVVSGTISNSITATGAAAGSEPGLAKLQKVVQEQRATIDELRAALNALEQRLERLESPR